WLLFATIVSCTYKLCIFFYELMHGGVELPYYIFPWMDPQYAVVSATSWDWRLCHILSTMIHVTRTVTERMTEKGKNSKGKKVGGWDMMLFWCVIGHSLCALGPLKHEYACAINMGVGTLAFVVLSLCTTTRNWFWYMCVIGGPMWLESILFVGHVLVTVYGLFSLFVSQKWT